MSNYNEEALKSAVQKGDLQSALNSLDADTAAKVKSVLNDPEAARQLLKSPQAQRLMKMFMKGNK